MALRAARRGGAEADRPQPRARLVSIRQIAVKRRDPKKAVATRLPPLSELKAKELNRKVTVVENGVERRVRVIELIFRQIATAAAGGSHPAIKTIIDIKAAIDAAPVAAAEPELDLTE